MSENFIPFYSDWSKESMQFMISEILISTIIFLFIDIAFAVIVTFYQIKKEKQDMASASAVYQNFEKITSSYLKIKGKKLIALFCLVIGLSIVIWQYGLYPLFSVTASSQLYISIKLENTKGVHTAIKRGANLEELPKYVFFDEQANNQTPLTYAIACNYDHDIMEYMIDQGADINKRNRNGDTPLEASVKAGDYQKLKILMARGAKPDQNLLKMTLELSENENIYFLDDSYYRLDQIVHILRQNNLETNRDLEKKAISKEYYGAIKDLLISRKDYLAVLANDNVSFQKNWPKQKEEQKKLFFFTCAFGTVDMIKYAQSQGLDLSIRNGRRETALMVACAYGNQKTAEYFIDEEISLQAEDEMSENCLMKSIYFRQKAISYWLIENYCKEFYEDQDEVIRSDIKSALKENGDKKTLKLIKAVESK